MRRPGPPGADADSSNAMPGGFTLVEVVVALLVLEVGVLGALATMVVAAETLRRAQGLERATGRVEAVLDSLRGGASPDSSSVLFDDVRIRWTVDDEGDVEIDATDPEGSLLLRARSTVPLVWGGGAP